MIFYFECPKVPFGHTIAFVLNLPLWVFIYSWPFAFNSKGIFSFVLFVAIAILVLGGLYPIGWLFGKIKSRLR